MREGELVCVVCVSACVCVRAQKQPLHKPVLHATSVCVTHRVL